MPTEPDILRSLEHHEVQLPPLALRLVAKDARHRESQRDQIDAILAAEFGGRTWRFAVEIKRLYTPKIIQNALATILPAAQRAHLNPMILVPYLSPANLKLLEQKKVSGIDLCGNGIVAVPSELLVFRTGNPNRFPQSAPIRNVYRGDSSLVARAFLVQTQFKAVGEIAQTIRELNGSISLPTVSKVLKALESDLIVTRENGTIRLLQPEKLLEQLSANYGPPKVKDRFLGKLALGQRELEQALARGARRARCRFILTGAASSPRYAVIAREPIIAAYCDRPTGQFLSALDIPAEPTDRFPNLDLIYTEDATVYFDPRPISGVPYASPVQSYLELMTGDKRQRESADQVHEHILQTVREKGGGTAKSISQP
jgi:hypothetical protein